MNLFPMPNTALKPCGIILFRVRSWKAKLVGSGRDSFVLSDAASRRTAFLKSGTERSGAKPYLCFMACSARDLAWFSLSVACFSSFANAGVILDQNCLMQCWVYLLRQRQLVDNFSLPSSAFVCPSASHLASPSG